MGNQVVAGVVPRWHGERPRDGAFAREVRARFGEIALHGLTHKQRRPSGVVSALTGMSNEFGGLDFTGALARVVEGYDTIAEMFGEAPRGFIPPAWDRGPASMRLLRACGLSYCAGMTALEGAGGERTPLSTWSWDSGRLAELGHLGHLMGHVMFAVRPRSVPCVVLHPADVARGFLPRARRLIDALLARGRRPVLFREFAESGERLAAAA